MKYWVRCQIITVGTNLSCDVDLNYVNKGGKTGFYDWEKKNGPLNLGITEGDWMYHSNKSGGVAGVTLCATSDSKNPYWSDPANYLVDLLGVQERFAEKIGFNEYKRGDGVIFKTGEAVRWTMWIPCA